MMVPVRRKGTRPGKKRKRIGFVQHRNKVNELGDRFDDAKTTIGDMITRAKTVREADAILKMTRDKFGNIVADEVWDHYVNWDKIQWKKDADKEHAEHRKKMRQRKLRKKKKPIV